MNITEARIDHLSDLARLSLPGGEKEEIARELEQHQVTLLKDVAMFDQMYELNLKYYKELTMYILAGKRRLEQL